MLQKIVLFTALAFSFQAFALNDHEIVKVVLTANEGEVDMAKAAAKKSENKEVTDFANMMIDDHKKNTDETKSLAKEQNIDPKKSDLSKNLEKDAKTWMKDIKKADKANIDKTYMDAQVTAHQKVLSTLDETLIPQATNAALKEKLMKTREAVAMHLSHAQEIQAKLK